MYGIEIKNLNNDVIIDGENKHPFLHESKVVSLSSTGFFEVEFTPISKTPFITIFTESGRVQILNIYKNSSDNYYQFSYAVGQTGGSCRFDIYTL